MHKNYEKIFGKNCRIFVGKIVVKLRVEKNRENPQSFGNFSTIFSRFFSKYGTRSPVYKKWEMIQCICVSCKERTKNLSQMTTSRVHT